MDRTPHPTLYEPGSAGASTVRRSAYFVGLILALSVLIMAAGRIQLTAYPQFTVFHASYNLVVALMTAFLLFGHFIYCRALSLLPLAAAFLLSGILCIPFLLSFPGAMVADTVLVGGPQSAIWTWHLWHLLFPALIAASVIVQRSGPHMLDERDIPRAVALTVTLVVLAWVAVFAAVTVFHDHLPVLYAESERPLTPSFYVVGGAAAAVTLAALVLTMPLVRQGSALHIWIAMVLLGLLADAGASLSAYDRYTVGWYFGRVEAMLASSVLLVLFLSDINRLYRSLAESVRDLAGANESKDQLLAEVRRRQEEFEALAENSTDIIARFDRDLRRVYVNRAIEAVLDHPREEILGKTHFGMGLPKSAADALDDKLRAVLETGQPRTVEDTVPTPAGERYLHSRLIPEFDPNGDIKSVLTITRDLTDRKQMEDALRISERRFRTLAENSPDLISRYDAGLRRVYANPAVAAVIGRPIGEILGKTNRELGQRAEAVEYAERLIREAFSSGKPQATDLHLPTPSGERVFDALAVPEMDAADEVTAVVTISRDITGRKFAEKALEESERKYRALVENLYEGIWQIDQDHTTIFVNARMAELLGYRVEEMLGRTVFSFMSAQAAEAARQNLEHGITGVRAEYDFEYLRKDGRPIWTHIVTTPLLGEDGEYRGALAGVIDITERKRAEEALRRREQELKALVEHSPDIVARVDRAGRLLYINPAIERITGRPQDWFLGKAPEQRELPPEEAALQKRAIEEVVESGEELVIEHTIPSATGPLFLHTRLVPEFNEEGEVASVLTIARDITELKRAQGKLEQLTLQDPLTGLANRRYLAKAVETEWRREARHQYPIALIMADIDHFKAYNDHYGHQDGDECLKRVAEALAHALHRPADTLVRYGGEEFAILLPETDLDGARDTAERLRHAVASLNLPHAASPVADHVTLSFGVASLQPHRGQFDELFREADAALYRAKAKGRDRVEVAQQNRRQDKPDSRSTL